MKKITNPVRTIVAMVLLTATVLTANAQSVGEKFQKGNLYYEITYFDSEKPEYNYVKVVPQNNAEPYWEESQKPQGDIVIGKGVEYEGNFFYITAIQESTFKDCQQLTSVELGYSIETIGTSAFENTGITSLTIYNAEEIGDNAFKNCSQLTTITSYIKKIESVTMGDNVFENVDKTQCKVTIPENTISAYKNSKGWSDFETFKENFAIGTQFRDDIFLCEITSLNPYEVSILEDYAPNTTPEGDFEIPATVTYKGTQFSVVEIGKNAFLEKDANITSLTLPNTLISIGSGAFASMSKVKKIHIPASVKNIGQGAFHSCYVCTSITVDKDNPYFCTKNNILFNKDKTRLLQYPIGIKDRYYSTPTTVKEVDGFAFSNSKLEKITFRRGITRIGNNACSSCDNLREVYIGSTIDYIGDNAFYSLNIEIVHFCTALYALKYVGKDIFPTLYNETRTLWAFQDDYEDWEQYFTDINYMHSKLTLLASNVKYGIRYGDKKEVDIVALDVEEPQPENTQSGVSPSPYFVSSAYNKQRSNSYSFDKLVIPSSVEINGETYTVVGIAQNAFNGCTSLTSVTIPKTVRCIEEGAFKGCTSLNTINLEVKDASQIRMGTDVFAGVDKNNCTVNIPKGATATYDSSQKWSGFTLKEKTATSVATVLTNPISIVGNNITVSKVAGKSVKLYSLSGQVLYNLHATQENITLSVKQAGTYILQVENRTRKVVVN